jgi:hypothetical protein
MEIHMSNNTENKFEPGAYKILAGRIATALAAGKEKGKAATKDRESAWGLFKSAIKFAADNGHTPEQMREGLGVYCLLAGIPQGTVNGYITDVTSMAVDVEAGRLSLVQVQEMSRADARKRYMDADKRAALEARKALADATEDWSAEQILALVALASEARIEAAPSQTNKGSTVASTPDRVQEAPKLASNG